MRDALRRCRKQVKESDRPNSRGEFMTSAKIVRGSELLHECERGCARRFKSLCYRFFTEHLMNGIHESPRLQNLLVCSTKSHCEQNSLCFINWFRLLKIIVLEM